jgi:hypothetical protein
MNYETDELTHRPQNVNLWETERMQAFRKAGLIGCLNGTGVTSKNYKCSSEWEIVQALKELKIIPEGYKDPEKSTLEMLDEIGFLGAIEDTEVDSSNLKGYERKYRVRRKVKA